jgi:hypothetical protein
MVVVYLKNGSKAELRDGTDVKPTELRIGAAHPVSSIVVLDAHGKGIGTFLLSEIVGYEIRPEREQSEHVFG